MNQGLVCGSISIMVESPVEGEESNKVLQQGNENNGLTVKQSNGAIVSSVQNLYVLHSENDLEELRNNASICQTHLMHGICPELNDCPRHHLRYENSPAIQVRNLFQFLGEESVLNPSELGETQANFSKATDKRLLRDYKKFYNNIIIKFRAAGPITMFKCCRNRTPYLNGNVYVRYLSHEFATRAVNMFNGFSFNGRELDVELCPVISWKASLCSHYEKCQACPEEESCRLLHTYSNPRDEYPPHTISFWDQPYPQTYKRILKSKGRLKGFGAPKEEIDNPKVAFFNTNHSNRLKLPEADQGLVTTTSVNVDLFEVKINDPQCCRPYIKTGACNLKDCDLLHPLRTDSTTIMIPHFFQHPLLECANDGRLLTCPIKESELQVAYKCFYESVIDKFRTAGRVVMFKTMRNPSPHAVGNVYVQYEDHGSAVAAKEQFNESKYATYGGFRAELNPVANWLIAVCSSFLKQKCCMRHNCYFLHPFDNPGNEYQGRVALNQDRDQLTAQLVSINNGKIRKQTVQPGGFGRNVFS